METVLTESGPAVIRPATSADDVAEIAKLFVEYAESLDFSLCFQGFDQELAGLPGAYAPPRGRLLLAEVRGRPAGGVGLRPLEPGVSEMKRLYVRPDFRGLKLGRRLAEAIVAAAREIGYGRMRLDTIETMAEARALYHDLGFVEIPPYYDNPVDGVRYYELDLSAAP